ncbi:hypothetical protein JW868_02320, partial [Candidatus Woesearchaeota archaeon]|nr:hypothetical protein [Candidatus Woesearchaeota archaeon]
MDERLLKLSEYLLIIGAFTIVIFLLIGSGFAPGLIYIFASRYTEYGWGGPNTTAGMMLANLLYSIIYVAFFTLIPAWIYHFFAK